MYFRRPEGHLNKDENASQRTWLSNRTKAWAAGGALMLGYCSKLSIEAGREARDIY